MQSSLRIATISLIHVSRPDDTCCVTMTGIGQKVLRLEYEAYVPMAEKELRKICEQMHEKWDLIKVAVGHRVGTCPVRDASVVITASSAHRAASLEAVHWAIDELKATVPIWKKEFFEDGEIWKENAESRRLYMAKQVPADDDAGN